MTIASNPTSYSIHQLPEAIAPEVLAKEAEVTAMKSWQGTSKLCASAGLTILGILGTFYSIYCTLVPWLYGVSIVAIGIGTASFQKFWADRVNGDKILTDWRACEADLAAGTAFRQFLEGGTKRELTWDQIRETHHNYKLATGCINS